MAFPRLSASMLLASFVLLLWWSTSLAQSHDLSSPDQSTPSRVKRTPSVHNKDDVSASLRAVKDSLALVQEVIGTCNTSQLSAVMKGLANFASLAPGVGGLASSIVVVTLAFIPQGDEMLHQVKEGFTEVDRKLDSLSDQKTNMLYPSTERIILDAWRKFTEFHKNHESAQSEDEKLHVAQTFINYYEKTGANASVGNLHRYLTGGNVPQALGYKYKCGIKQISSSNFYFSSLLWKAMVLNQFYGRLIGLDSSNQQTEHVQMFNDVYEAQKSVVEFCMNHHTRYITDDVLEISKALGSENKEVVAVRVKHKLDEKYYWYNWVVLVYDSKEDHNYFLYNMTKVPVGKITVAVGYTQRAKEECKDEVGRELTSCYKYELQTRFTFRGRKVTTPCETVVQRISQCSRHVSAGPVNQFVKVMFIAYNENFVQVPGALQSLDCRWNNHYSKISVYYSRTLDACHQNSCENGGTCRRLLDSNEHLCECPHGWHGDRCEKRMNTNYVPPTAEEVTVPTITVLETAAPDIIITTTESID